MQRRSPMARGGGKRVGAAAAVVLLHAILAGLLLVSHQPSVPDADAAADSVTMTLTELLPSSNITGPLPINVELAPVLRLRELAPPVLGIPTDLPEPLLKVEGPSLAAAALVPGESESGVNGSDGESGGQSGGGNQLRLLQRVIPRYPAAAARRREQGVTGMRIQVGENGRVTQVSVARSSGSNSLDAAAVNAARKWRFAPMPAGSAPNGMLIDTEQRFVLYLFQYSLIGSDAADRVYAEQVKPGEPDEEIPGGTEALARFIAQVQSGGDLMGTDVRAQAELARMRAALREWGEAREIRFTAAVGNERWLAYRIPPPIASAVGRRDVEVSWNLFEVEHPKARSTWLVAVDRDGRVWDARASPTPW